MPDDLQGLIDQGVALHERFITDMRAMDAAWAGGTLDTWLDEQLAAARQEAQSAVDRS